MQRVHSFPQSRSRVTLLAPFVAVLALVSIVVPFVVSEGARGKFGPKNPYLLATSLQSVKDPSAQEHQDKGSCGPPNYCSRDDLNTAQLGNSIPSVGHLVGANTIVVDPSFGSRITRVTDAHTDPDRLNFTFTTAASGSSDENVWNTDSTMFIVYNTGGRAYPFAFDPQSMRASRLYASKSRAVSGLVFDAPAQWSRANPQTLYAFSGTQILEYFLADRQTPPTPRVVYDYRSSTACLGSKFPTDQWSTVGGIAASDTAFAMAYADSGGQDGAGANFVAVYAVGKGCRVLNTATGQITGDWGPTGTIEIPDRVHVHNAKLSKDGNWVVITWNNCVSSACPHSQPFFWNVPTLKVSSMNSCPKDCAGHWTEGSKYFFYENANNPPDFVLRPFDEIDKRMVLNLNHPNGFSTPWDQHPSWNYDSAADNMPVCTASFTPTGAPASFAFAWQDEVLCVATDGSGKVWRFAHTFNTDRSHRFSTSEAIGTTSQDGRLFLLSSDWMGTLGSESGSSSCTIGSNCRGDVFVVELK